MKHLLLTLGFILTISFTAKSNASLVMHLQQKLVVVKDVTCDKNMCSVETDDVWMHAALGLKDPLIDAKNAQAKRPLYVTGYGDILMVFNDLMGEFVIANQDAWEIVQQIDYAQSTKQSCEKDSCKVFFNQKIDGTTKEIYFAISKDLFDVASNQGEIKPITVFVDHNKTILAIGLSNGEALIEFN